ncbi:MAG: hypothetical protein RL180_929 [Pseudomonadota bacterium]
MTAAMTLCVTTVFDSPLGPLYVQHNGMAIHQLSYQRDADTLLHPPMPATWSQILLDYFAGEFDRINQLPIQLNNGTAFQQAVWLALRQIPVGTTVSYRELAEQINRPLAVRAVGQALKRNPLPIVLPCHRVIRQSGDLGGYSGLSDMGQSRKRFLLWHEGAYPQSTP